MKLLGLHIINLDHYHVPKVISESGYGRTYGFKYDNWNVDPRPQMLILGRWRHPRTKNDLAAGVNLNYLNDDQIMQLRQALPSILRTSRNLKKRYWAAMELLPNIMNKAYRTYDTKYIDAISPGTLRYSRKPEAPVAVAPSAPPKAPKPRVPTPSAPRIPAAAPPEPPKEVEPPEAARDAGIRRREEAARKQATRGTRLSRAQREKELEEPEAPESEEV